MTDTKDEAFLNNLGIPSELKDKVNLNPSANAEKESIVEKLKKGLYKNNDEFRADLARIGNDLSGSHLENVDFRGLDLSEIILNSSWLSYARFEGVKLVNTKLVFVDVRGAKFKGALLSRADLSVSDCSDADFSFADLDFANLRGTNCSGTKFIMSRLTMADLSDSNLMHADFSGAETFGMMMNDCLIADEEISAGIQYGVLEKQEIGIGGGRSVYASSGGSVYTGGNSRYIGGSKYV